MTKRIQLIDYSPAQPAVAAIVNEPSVTEEGVRYIVGDSPTGVFEGFTNRIAYYYQGEWHFDLPAKGWMVHVNSEDRIRYFDGVSWVIHDRLHDVDSEDDHGAATGDKKGKYVRANPFTGKIEFADVAELEFLNDQGVVYWRYVGDQQWKLLIDLSGVVTVVPEFRFEDGWLQWRLADQTPEDIWKNIIHIDDLTRDPQFRIENDLLQWKFEDELEWTTLADLSAYRIKRLTLTIVHDEQINFSIPGGITQSHVTLNGLTYTQDADYTISGTTLSWADDEIEQDDELILYYQ